MATLFDRYWELCEQHNHESDVVQRRIIAAQAHGFCEAVDILQGDLSSTRLGMRADLELPEDGRPACLGMYLDMHNHPAELAKPKETTP